MSIICDVDNYEYLTVDTNVDLSGNDELTLCAFIKPTSLLSGPRRFLCSSWGTSYNQNWLLATGDDYAQIRVATGTSAASWVNTGDILSINTWYHIAGVYDGSDMYVFVDATQEATKGLTGNVRNVGGSSTAIFTDPNQATTRNNDCELYDVRIYNRALSLAEIQTIYQSKGRDSIFHGLKHRWKMNEFPSGTSLSGAGIIKDDVGGYSATPVNTPTMGEVNVLKRDYNKR